MFAARPDRTKVAFGGLCFDGIKVTKLFCAKKEAAVTCGYAGRYLATEG